MSQDLMNLQMDILQSHQGELVKCIYWDKGEQKQVEGKLIRIIPFDSLLIEGSKTLTFVGPDVAIERVISLEHKKSGDNDDIYLCSAAIGYQGVNEHDHFALVNAQMSMLGKSPRLDSLNQAYDNATPEQRVQVIGGRGYHDVGKSISVVTEEKFDDVGKAR